ncbi:CHAT domain-containing protein [Parapedobacter sp. 2B3]|uniref:CHAT domain-containing protein n=1 Tax=Parapedobacter sp. 2B3 TaxID=3342381 RepID=UPI0035B5BC06
MKSSIVFAGILWAVLSVVQAQPNAFNDHYAMYMEGYAARDLSKMKAGSEQLMRDFPDEFAGYYLHAFYQLCAGDAGQAAQDAEKAFRIDPISPYPYLVKSYIAFIKGEPDQATNQLHYAVQLRSHKTMDDVHTDIDVLAHFTEADFSHFGDALAEVVRDGVMNPALALAFDQCFVGASKGTPCDNIDALAAQFNAMKYANPHIQQIVPLTKAINYYSLGNRLESEKQFEAFLTLTAGDPSMAWKRSYAGWFLSILKNDRYDARGALLTINHALEGYQPIGFPSYQLASMQLHKIHVLDGIGDKQEEKLQVAHQLEQTANGLNSDYFKAKAYNSIGAHHLLNGAVPDLGKSSSYLTKAYQLAQQVNDPNLTREVNGNYIIVKAKQGLYGEAARITEETAQGYLQDSIYDQAQNLYNNLGFIYFNNKSYPEAITQFEKSTALVEQVKSGLDAKQKLAYMNEVAGVYGGLAMSYRHTGEIGKLFTAQEQSRSGYLKEMLQHDVATATIADAQSLLKPDEVLLTYSIGRPGELIITAITNEQAELRYHYPIDDLLRFKKAYTDRVKKIPAPLNPYLNDLNVDYHDGQLVQYATKEAAYKKADFVLLVEWTRQLLESDRPDLQPMQRDFLRFWYDLALAPVQDILAQYRTVIISPAQELNYLPFEAFLTPNNAHFIERHDVRYIPSTTVWKILAARRYTADRKPAIAFGGAFYQPSGNIEPTARGIEDFYHVSDAINRKISLGDYNFKQELEAVGFGGANYLAGTLNEVQYIGSLADDVTVFTGYEMSESRFKALDATGELTQYRNLLISTHGFTTDIIPEFSGVMFSQPDGGDANEDTYLLAPEIARLHLNTDLVVLSACDTGVGKLYGGEGINGLNTAFLIAGSNATLLSLWPVDDAGTALTMQNLFRKVVQEQAAAGKTLHAIKRAFVKGDFGDRYKQPKYWAPFIYNGI